MPVHTRERGSSPGFDGVKIKFYYYITKAYVLCMPTHKGNALLCYYYSLDATLVFIRLSRLVYSVTLHFKLLFLGYTSSIPRNNSHLSVVLV